jgi:hypothetical protein
MSEVVCKECGKPLTKDSRDKYGRLCKFHFLQKRKEYRLKQLEKERQKYPVVYTAWGPFILVKKKVIERELEVKDG